MIKYAIFDMDGTLTDSMHIWDTCASAFLMMRGINGDEFKMFRKQGYKPGIKYLREKYNLDLTDEEIMRGLFIPLRYYYTFVAEAKPKVKEFLENLKKMGIKMAVATATDRFLVEACLKRNGLFDYFDVILSTVDIGKSKSSPDIFYAARDILGAESSSEVWVFEDALYAMETAKKAGFGVIAMKDYSAEDDTEKIKKVADFYFEDYERAMSFLGV